MYITEYLSNEVKPGKVNSTPSQLLEVVHEYKLTHLPLFKGLDFVGNISEEDLAELAVDTQFKQANRIKILNEYYFMIGERELLRKSCTPNYPPSTPAKEFMHKGEIYMVIEESNVQY